MGALYVSVQSNALNRASARDFYAADYYDDADYYDEEYDAEYDAYLMYEEAAENLERAEREFELMQQLLNEEPAQGTATDGKKFAARDSYFDEYYYDAPETGTATKPKFGEAGKATKPKYGGVTATKPKFGGVTATKPKFGGVTKKNPKAAARNGYYSDYYGEAGKATKPKFGGVTKKNPKAAARDAYSNYFGEAGKATKPKYGEAGKATKPKYGEAGKATKPKYSSRMLDQW